MSKSTKSTEIYIRCVECGELELADAMADRCRTCCGVDLWVLREELASKRRKKPVYFRFMTAIGPCCTEKIYEAERFETAQEAKMSPAYVHALSCYKPERLQHG